MQVQRLGELLVQNGVLTDAQVQHALGRQAVDQRPFGQIAQSLFGTSLRAIAVALAEQVLADAPQANLVTERSEAAPLGLITAKDAWDNLVLPLRIDSGTLVCATTEETLANAIELIAGQVAMPFRFVLTEIRPLEQFIAERYHYEGVET